MSNYSLFKFLYLISIIYIVSNALSIENIIGGRPANSEKFQYQVGIVGKRNLSNERQPIGGGAIISSNYITTALLNFFNKSYELRQFTYYIVAGTTDINNPRILIEIDEIYITHFQTYSKLFHDISVAKLKLAFDFYNMQLKPVTIRTDKTSLIGYKGIVSGYGFNTVQTGTDAINGKRKRISGESNGLLHYAKLEIVDSSHCHSHSRYFNDISQICATVELSLSSEPVGICSGDGGNPLVIDNILVGVAHASTIDCNNKVYGGIYINISHFSYFINRIIKKKWELVALAFKNLPHVPPPS